tara:strand:+ start:3866 stop:4063 length:198 start_codon:yes stop_codon:yes gene_type:complete
MYVVNTLYHGYNQELEFEIEDICGTDIDGEYTVKSIDFFLQYYKNPILVIGNTIYVTFRKSFGQY